ncbi:MAG: hypothetical protein GY859_07065 [Desulfobacterales bacterium]|nr:hypothetical protein [Desulfobacterales bacterium]
MHDIIHFRFLCEEGCILRATSTFFRMIYHFFTSSFIYACPSCVNEKSAGNGGAKGGLILSSAIFTTLASMDQAGGKDAVAIIVASTQPASRAIARDWKEGESASFQASVWFRRSPITDHDPFTDLRPWFPGAGVLLSQKMSVFVRPRSLAGDESAGARLKFRAGCVIVPEDELAGSCRMVNERLEQIEDSGIPGSRNPDLINIAGGS